MQTSGADGRVNARARSAEFCAVGLCSRAVQRRDSCRARSAHCHLRVNAVGSRTIREVLKSPFGRCSALIQGVWGSALCWVQVFRVVLSPTLEEVR